MAEYIERKRAIVDACNSLELYPSEYAKLEDALNKVPAADVAPVWHGYWIGLEYDGYADDYPVYNLWECSECGEEVRGEDVLNTHLYCPNCGAKMDQTE